MGHVVMLKPTLAGRRGLELRNTLRLSLFILLWLSSCRSTISHVGVNPHGSAEKVKLLLNSSHLEPQAVKLPRHHGDDDSE
jgi:hypothetical protein